jgi:hypothetical protein
MQLANALCRLVEMATAQVPEKEIAPPGDPRGARGDLKPAGDDSALAGIQLSWLGGSS